MYEERNQSKQKQGEEARKSRPERVAAAVPQPAAGLFLSRRPIRDQKAYHDGSVCIYQQHAEQKTHKCIVVLLTEAERTQIVRLFAPTMQEEGSHKQITKGAD